MNTQWSRLLVWFFGGWLLMSGPAFADKYNKGLDAFRDGEYSKAYKILSGVVKKTKNKSDKAEAMALMGAAAAKMGKESKAESLFAKALKLDPDVSLSRDTMKDKAVRKLFNKAQKHGGDVDRDDFSGDDFSGDDFDGDDFGDDDRSERMSSKSSGDSSYKEFIPFGLGYLFNGDIGKGLIYGGAQAAGIVGFLYYNGEISKANADADAIGQEALAQQAANQPVDQETLDFLDVNEAFVKAAQSNQKLMLAIAAGGYGLSVLDGFLFGKSGGGSKKPRRRADTLLPTAQSLAEQGREQDLDTDEVEEAPRLWNMKLHLLPKQDPGLMLSINRSF
jgi:tetratricopeptide (TPR) repeat protein